jgi:hypothetical protein
MSYTQTTFKNNNEVDNLLNDYINKLSSTKSKNN